MLIDKDGDPTPGGALCMVVGLLGLPTFLLGLGIVLWSHFGVAIALTVLGGVMIIPGLMLLRQHHRHVLLREVNRQFNEARR